MSDDRTTPTHRLVTRALYLQVRDALAERIAGGEWKPGSAIPNEGDLSRQFGVSAGTMRKALEVLEDERLLTRRQGRGTFVNDQTSDELAVRYSNLRTPGGERIVGQVRTIEAVETNRRVLEEKLDQVDQASRSRDEVLELAIRALRGDVVEIRADVVEIRSDIVEIRGDIVEIRGDISGIRGDIVEIRGDITGIHGDIAGIRGDIGRLSSQVAPLEPRITALERRRP